MQKPILAVLVVLLQIKFNANAQQDMNSYENPIWNKSSLKNPTQPLAHPIAREIQILIEKSDESFDVVENYCMRNRPSPKESLGCIQAYLNLVQFCDKQKDKKFLHHFTYKTQESIRKSCIETRDAAGMLSSFFDHDQSSCAVGFKNLSDVVVKIRETAPMMDDVKFAERTEKNSCIEFKKYKNLCRYVDGDMKNIEPTNFAWLPKLNPDKDNYISCETNQENSIQFIEMALVKSSKNLNQNIYSEVIKKLKSRMPTSDSSAKSVSCEAVRSSYYNLNCDVFESVTDKDPIYLSDEELKKKRLDDNKAKDAFDSQKN